VHTSFEVSLPGRDRLQRPASRSPAIAQAGRGRRARHRPRGDPPFASRSEPGWGELPEVRRGRPPPAVYPPVLTRC
jgi:hypothetical protein